MVPSEYGICGEFIFVLAGMAFQIEIQFYREESNEYPPSQILRKFSTRYAWINHLDIMFCCNVYLSVNDICIHPNQGEVISCDQAGSIKQWDLSDNICSHELVQFILWMFWWRWLRY